MAKQAIHRISEIVRHYLPLLLAVCYGVALLLPRPGQAIHGWSLPEAWPEVARPTVSQLLVAVLLLLAAMGVEVRKLPAVAKQPGLLVASLASVWLMPAMVVLLGWWMMPWLLDSASAARLTVGFALVAAMPVANSAAAWTQQSRGELAWTLALIVLSIVLCPWLIPLVLGLLGLSFSAAEAAGLEQLTTSFTGLEFVVWVLLPTGVGMLVRWAVGAQRVADHRRAVLLTSAGTLLLLNYINAAAALPKMKSEFQLVWLVACVGGALVLCLVGLATAHVLGRLFPTSSTTIRALDYSLAMKNTGLALALASELKDHPILLLPVFTMTLVQHLFAGAMHRLAMKQEPPPEAP